MITTTGNENIDNWEGLFMMSGKEFLFTTVEELFSTTAKEYLWTAAKESSYTETYNESL